MKRAKNYLERVFQYSVPEEGEREQHRGWYLLEGLSLYLPIFIAAFGFMTIVLLYMGMLTDAAVLYLALPFSVLVVGYSIKKLSLRFPGSLRERRWGSVAILALVVGWIGWNIHYNSENIYISRDPGAYNVTARWLMTSDNLVIQGSSIFGDDRSITPDTAAYELVRKDRDDRIYVQAPHLFPVLLGLSGRVAGVEGMVKANVIIGGLALLVVYGFMRLLVRPRWALLAIGVLAVSLPMLYFSRDTYTEPLTMLLIFGALSCLAAVRKSKNYILWGIAGAVAAAAVLARIDAYLFIGGILAALVVILLLEPSRQAGRALLKRMGAFLMGAGVVAFIGWLDVYVLSKKYFIDLAEEFSLQMALIIFILIAGPIVVAIEWKKRYFRRFFTAYSRQIRLISLAIIVVVALFLASRPLWMQATEVGANATYLASLQQRDGDPIESNRTYAEYSVYWIAWYIGPAIVLFSVLGFMVAFRSLFRKTSHLLIPIMLVFGVMAALYFLTPRITPDQIWAIRRFLPIIIPAICLFGVIGLQQLYDAVPKKDKKASVVIAVIIGAVLVPPLYISGPFLKHKEFAGQLQQIQKVCDALPENAAVLLVGGNGINMTQTIRAYCHVPAERTPAADREKLAEAAKAAKARHYTPVVFMIGYEVDRSSHTLIDFTRMDMPYTEMKRELTHPPRIAEPFVRTILLGEISENGVIKPLEIK